jgi:hypothetical protein
MPVYSLLGLGTSLSTLITNIDAQHEAIRSAEYGATEPTIKPTGVEWQCTNGTVLTAAGAPAGVTAGKVRWNGTAWQFVHTIGLGALLNAGGDVSLTGPFKAGNQRLTGVGAATTGSDAPRYDQVLRLDGSNGGWTGNQNAGTRRITNLGAPTAATDAARLQDVQALTYTGRGFYNTNRDAAGLGTPATVKQQLEADQPAGHTILGFTPREITLRLSGRFRRQDNNNGVGSNPAFNGLEITVRRWDAQSAGGDAGTPTTSIVHVPISGAADLKVIVAWRYTAGEEGFTLRFKWDGTPNTDDGVWMRLRNASDVSVDGAIHAFAKA